MSGTDRAQRWRVEIDRYLQERLQAKLDKLKDGQADEVGSAAALRAEHRAEVWLEDAARRVRQIQAVTHTLKAIHPEARGTNLYVAPGQLPALPVVGSHVLGQEAAVDVVGNAAALDVYKFLRLTVNGQTLLDALLSGDEAAERALSADATQAKNLREAYIGLIAPRAETPASHTLAKQVYWLTGDDPWLDDGFLMLAPLFASSLAQEVHTRIQEARFGEAHKAARAARREGVAHDGVLHEYPGLAVRNLGGSKPQNVSQLNSERRGLNYLLASLPPTWRPDRLRLPVHADSVFDRLFNQRPTVRGTVHGLRSFLASNPKPNDQTRQHRAMLVDALVDELVAMAAEFQEYLPAGWTRPGGDRDRRFERLAAAEKLWLDPLRGGLSGEDEFAREWLLMDWPAEVGRRFGNWLNAALRDLLPVGDAEAREWKKVLLIDEDGFMAHVREQRRAVGAAGAMSNQRTDGEMTSGAGTTHES